MVKYFHNRTNLKLNLTRDYNFILTNYSEIVFVKIRNSSGSGSSSGNLITLIESFVQVVNPGKIPAGKTEIPFQLALECDANNNTDNGNTVQLFETYHGVKINIDYFVGAEIKRSGILASNVVTKPQEFFVEIKIPKSEKTGEEENSSKYDFVMTPETLRKKKKKNSDSSTTSAREVSDFCIRGHLDSTNCVLSDPLAGLVVVERSDRPIKSLELQLLRVESVTADDSSGPPMLRATSEVQNVQVGIKTNCRH
jgi:hypothetical protein